MNLFEEGTRLKVRFKTSRGQLAMEDLFGLSMQSLDRIGKTVKKERREQEDSMLGIPKEANTLHELKLRIIQYVIDDKKKETRGAPVKTEEETEEIL